MRKPVNSLLSGAAIVALLLAFIVPAAASEPAATTTGASQTLTAPTQTAAVQTPAAPAVGASIRPVVVNTTAKTASAKSTKKTKKAKKAKKKTVKKSTKEAAKKTVKKSATTASKPAADDESTAKSVLASLKATYKYLDGVTVSIGTTPGGYQAVSYYTAGRIVISPKHTASIQRILNHEIWHEIDWRDNGHIDWNESVPPKNASSYRK